MKLRVILSSCLCIFSLLANGAEESIERALQHGDRQDKDIAADMLRKPAKVMAFFEFKPGLKVLDVFSGAGYYTEIAARVVGQTGHVDAHNNAPYVAYIGAEKLAARYANQRLPNVTQLLQDANQLHLPANYYDRILLILSFHDLYHVDEENGWHKIDDMAFLAKLHAALKPRGYLAIIDHVAPAGSGSEAGNSIHRIDPEIIKDKMRTSGFTLVDEADFLQNLADPLDIPMWDPKVRGRTHRVVLKYSK